MGGRKYGVLIGSSRFDKDSRLEPLRCPENDIKGLARVLEDPKLGGFENVEKLSDKTHNEALYMIEKTLKNARPDDFVLLYYAGHGRPDVHGELHLATKDTECELLGSTSISMERIKSFLEKSPCPRVAIILDCCYSGLAGKSFARGGDVDQHLANISKVRGTFILTASRGTQVAFEKEGDEYGLLTKHILRGIETGDADTGGDDAISMDELYRYVRDAVSREAGQVPECWAEQKGAELEISRTKRKSRELRRRKVTKSLSAYSHKGALPNSVFKEALDIIAKRPIELGPTERERDRLLDLLHAGKLKMGDFLDRWKDARGEEPPKAAAEPPPAPARIAAPLPTTYQECATLSGHTRLVWSVHFSPDGALLASGSKDNSIRVWNLPGGGNLRILQGHTDDVNCVRFSPDGKTLATASDDYTIRLWPMPVADQSKILKSHTMWVRSLDFGPHNTLVSGGDDNTVRIWNLDSAEEAKKLSEHTNTVFGVAFSPDQRLLATASKDCAIRLWDTAEWKTVRVLTGHTSDVNGVAFSPDGRLLASASDDRTVRLWDVDSGMVAYTISGPNDRAWSVAFRPDGLLLACGSDDGCVRLFNARTWALVQTLKTYWFRPSRHCIRSVAFSPDGSVLAAAGKDCKIRLWRVEPPPGASA